ncbi:hypothetical protein GCM10009827_084030 [Dactylosporangium maewongense]|uniref:Uncharacterized protein n=1 Tax=Dactylosporangium maewongense TaxID=634393 RepID=A0ABN2C2K9_9ACTN
MTAVKHPAWCDVAECTAEPGHLHYSRPINVPAIDGNPDSARFICVVFGDADSRPLLELGIVAGAGLKPPPVVEVDAPQLRHLHAAFGAVLHVLTAADPAATELPTLDPVNGGAQS